MQANNSGGWLAGLRPSAPGGLAVVLLSVVTSIVSSGLLPERFRIRWTVGNFQHYGPEHVPTLAVLVAFPAALAALYLGSRWLRSRLERTDRFEEDRALYEQIVLAVLGSVVVLQVGIILLNLWHP